MTGWEPAEVTTYVYEGDRLVRSVTVREPEYDREQRALLVASQRVEAALNRFGIPWSEATDPRNQFEKRFEGYVNMDYSEKAYLDYKDWYLKEFKDAPKNGLAFGVRRVTGEGS